MTDILLAPPKQGATPDDETGHYQCTTPDGELKRHKRASDFTGLLDDNYKLRQHEDRELAHGVALNMDLIALARAHRPDGDTDDKRVYDRDIIPRARMLAGSGSKANIGTALHRNMNEVDRGTPMVALDPDWRSHLQAYADIMATIPFRVVTDHIEQTVILDGHRIAGTIDRILEVTRDITVTFPNGRKVELKAGDLIVGDIKTGKWFTPLKWMIQLACYAHHTATWIPADDHPHGGVRSARILVRDDIALVIHLQAGIPAAPPDLIWLDLAAGYDAFLTAVEIAGHRSAAKKASALFTDHLPSAITQQAEHWCRARMDTVKTNQAATACLKRLWPFRDEADRPIPFDRIERTPTQIETMLGLLDRIEAEYGLPFTPQPGVQRADETSNQPETNPGENQ